MSLEAKRKKLELSRVAVARQEQELKIDEYLDQIEKLKVNIEIQKKREGVLIVDINTIEGKINEWF